MENISFLTTVQKKIGTIVLVAVLFASLSFVGLIMYSKNFRAGTDLLIVQNSESKDFYSMLKSTEYLGNVLNESIYSDRFITAIVESGKVGPNFLSESYNISTQDKKGQLDAWADMVHVKRNTAAGIMHIDVAANDKRTTIAVSSAITDVLTQKNMLFRGGDEKSVEIRVLSGPIIENDPSIQKMIITVISGFIAGLCIALMWIFVKEELLPKTSTESTIIEF